MGVLHSVLEDVTIFLYYAIPHKGGFFFETFRAGDTVNGEARKEL